MRRSLHLLFLLAALAAAGSASAGGIGAKVGTLGLGGEVLWEPPLLRLVDVRVGLNRFDFGQQRTFSTIDYDMDLRLSNAFVAASLHLPLSSLRLTGAVYANSNRVDLVSRPDQTIMIGGTPYPAHMLGSVEGRVGFRSRAPYAGLGMDFRLVRAGLSLDAGVLLQGSPEVALEAEGPITTLPQFQQELEEERARIEDDLSRYRVYPVVSATLYWLF